MTGELRLIDTNVKVHAYTVSDEVMGENKGQAGFLAHIRE